MPAAVRSRSCLWLASAAFMFAAGALVGCGSSSASNSITTTTTFPPLRPPPKQPPKRPDGPRLPYVGQTQRVHAPGTVLSVTIRQLVDPLRDSGAALLPGTRAVGVIAQILNDGPGVYDSSATGDFSVVTAAGAARPVFAPGGACQTPLRDWDNEISPSELRSGCVVFSVPARARILAVRFSPHAVAQGRATWVTSR